MFLQHFQCQFSCNKVKIVYTRITTTHVRVSALTLSGSLGRLLSTRPIGTFLGTQQMSLYEKVCVVPILFSTFMHHYLRVENNKSFGQTARMRKLVCAFHIHKQQSKGTIIQYAPSNHDLTFN